MKVPLNRRESYQSLLLIRSEEEHPRRDISGGVAPPFSNDDGIEEKYTPPSDSSPFEVRKSENPFAGKQYGRPPREGVEYKRIEPPGLVKTKAERPWGLKLEDPREKDVARDSPVSLESAMSRGTKNIVRTKTKASSSGSSNSSTRTAASSGGAAKLTHLTSDGEAHMVDVGAKESTRRVAIAFGTVRFSNPESHRLITENANKKGDVLGVARIAGIMAAKRTSDIIPLCHPLGLTKVEVEVKLQNLDERRHMLWRQSSLGVVTIQALAECTGQTGVEMEALTAVSGAALTVYDMCKAVDKEMVMTNVKVVYKSGGMSGIFGVREWVNWVGERFLRERGLEVPGKEMGAKAETSMDGEKAKQGIPKVVMEKTKTEPVLQQSAGTVVRHATSSVVDRAMGQGRSARTGRKEDYTFLRTSASSSPTESVSRSIPASGTHEAPTRSPDPNAATPKARSCRTCGATGFLGKKSLDAHFREEHFTPPTESDQSEKTFGKPRTCEDCEQVLPSRSALMKHRVAEHGWAVLGKDIKRQRGDVKYDRILFRAPQPLMAESGGEGSSGRAIAAI